MKHLIRKLLLLFFFISVLMVVLFRDTGIIKYLYVYIFLMFLYLCRDIWNKVLKKNKISYGYYEDKTIDLDSVPILRDIPCNGDIYYAYILIKLNNLIYDNSNVIGAIILKWIRDKKVNIIEVKKDDSNDVVKAIDLRNNFIFENQFENKLYSMMKSSSYNGILETNEFVDYVKRFDMEFLALFSKLEDEMIDDLKRNFHIYHRIKKGDCKNKYVLDDKIYNDSLELYGFYKFLLEFSSMDAKKITDLHLWEDYLIFASLFGLTDKINSQLKEMTIGIEEVDIYDFL